MLLKMQEEQGITPPALQNMPLLSIVEDWCYGHFRELSLDRRYTDAGPLPITTVEIREYWRLFIRFDFNSFYENMRLIDGIYLEAVTEKRKKTESKKPTLKPSQRNQR